VSDSAEPTDRPPASSPSFPRAVPTEGEQASAPTPLNSAAAALRLARQQELAARIARRQELAARTARQQELAARTALQQERAARTARQQEPSAQRTGSREEPSPLTEQAKAGALPTTQDEFVGLPSVRTEAPDDLTAAAVPFLPQRGGRRSYGTIVSFIVCVVLPVVVAAVYYLGFASNQYVAEFRFAVRDAQSAITGSSAASGIASLSGLGGMTAAPNPMENYIVTEFITSRQAVEELETRIGVMKLYSRPGLDWWSRFDRSDPIEKFAGYWRNMVSANFDQITGIATAQVRAFTPEDAYLIATTLVSLSEELINRIANRPQRDAVRFAENDVKRAEDRLKSIRGELTKYRNSEQLIDPQANVVTSNVLQAQALRATINQLQADLKGLRNEKTLSRNAPAVKSLEARIEATREQLAVVESGVKSMRDGSNPLSKVVAEFEQLELERQFAQNMVLSTKQRLEEARANLLAQHIYVTPFVSPALPQSSTYPRRFVSIAITALIASLFWVVGLLLVRSVREHLN